MPKTTFAKTENHTRDIAENINIEDLSKLTVPQLKERLKAVGLRTGGRKAELIERLSEHLQSQGDAEPAIDSESDIEITDDSDEELPPNEARIDQHSATTEIASVVVTRVVQDVIDSVVHNETSIERRHRAVTKIASVWRGKRARMQAGHVENTPTPCACDVYGGHQPKDRDRAREYLKMLHDTERFDELWEIWTQLKQNQVEDHSAIKRGQKWPTPCKEHAENVYFAAKDMTNYGATFIIGQKPKHDTDVQTIVASESVPPTPVACQEPVSEEPLMHKHEGKWCEVSSATLNAKRGFDIVLDDGTDKTVSRKQLVRFPKQVLPTVEEILRAGGVQSLPQFYPVQQEMFNAADKNGHRFYGGFQRLKRKWVWNKDATETNFQDGTLKDLAVYEYFSFESRQAFEVFYSTVPQDCKCFFEMAREGTTVKLYLDVDDEDKEQSRSKLDEIIPLLCEYYQTSFGKSLDAKQIAVTDGSRQKSSCYKNSFHLTINNGHGLVAPVIGEDNDMKTFVYSFVAHLESIGRSDLAGTVDKGVYTPNRMMRMIGSCKADDTTKTPFRQLGDGNVADHYIQSDGALVVIELPAKLRANQKCAPCKKTPKKRAREPVITVSTSKFYSTERNEKRSVAQCIEASQSGDAHWQESFNDPHRLVKLYFDVDLTLKGDEFDEMDSDELNRTFDKYRTEYPDAICNWLCEGSDLELSHKDIAVSDSSGMKHGHYHLSFHAVVQRFCCKFGDIKAVLMDHGLWDAKTNALTLDRADCGVYGRNHMFRMIGCKKQVKGTATEDRVLSAVTLTDDLGAHIVQNVTDEKVLKPSKESILSTKTAKVANVDDDIREYLESHDMTIVSCRELKPETDLFCSAPQKPAKTIGVRCVCPFAKRRHKSNHCYVIVNETGAYIKCHDEDCKGRADQLDWVPRKQAQPMQGDSVEITDSASEQREQPTVADSDPDDPENSNGSIADAMDQAIIDLLVWKLSHPYYRLNELHQNVDDAMSGRLGFTSVGTRVATVDRRKVTVAEFMSTVKLCPNWQSRASATDMETGATIKCDGRFKLKLVKDMPHVMHFDCPCCSQLKDAEPKFERVGPPGFHRDDTRVHELIWPDYDSVRGGLNHIAVFENDEKPGKIPHGTRCKMYITNQLNDYAMRKKYCKRGSVVQVRSKTCPIAYETELVGTEEMTFDLFIQQAERALPRLKETLKTSDYEKWATWCDTADHVEFPRLKPDRHLLAFSNVAVDITDGNMVIKEFGECTGRVARSFNDIKFKKKYAKLSFEKLLKKCPLFCQYIETHFPSDLVQRFNFKHRQGTQDWWIGKIFCAMLGRLLFEVNELDKWRTMLYILGPKNCGKSELWKTIIQQFFDMSNVYTYEKEPDKFSVQAMVGKEIAVAPDLKTQVQDAGTLQSMVCGEAVANRDMRKIAESVSDWKVPQLFISNLLPPWKNDESGALMSRFLIFQFQELKGETDTSLPLRIVQKELAVVFALILRAGIDLRAYVGTAPAEDWNLPYFNDVRASEEKRKQHLYRFLTEPRGNIRTKDTEIWVEPAEGEVTLLVDLKKKFELYMKFQYPGVSYSWDDQFPSACLSKAAAHHEYNPGWKITNRETFNQCAQCGKDVDKKYDITTERGDCCCKWFYDQTHVGPRGSQCPSMRAMIKAGIVKKGKTKASESPDKIKGLVIREEKFGAGSADTLCALPWDGACNCVRKDSKGRAVGREMAVMSTSNSDSNPGREFYTCMRGEHGCGFFQWADQLPS